MSLIFQRLAVKAEESQLIRPSDLPLYDEPSTLKYEAVKQEPGHLQQNIKLVRETATSVSDQVKEVGDQINHVYETGIAHSQGAYNQLLDEENLLARLGVIAGFSTFGLVVGLVRGRMLKRVVYTGLGAGTGSAICYPEDTTQIANNLYSEARKKAMIAYNFINGVETPGHGPAESSLIASSIVRFSRAVARYIAEIRAGIANSSSTTGTRVEGEVQSNNVNRVILMEDDGERRNVVGDPGQGKEEDKDLYTTRS